MQGRDIEFKIKKISRVDPAAKKEEDSKTLLKALSPQDYVILLEEKAKSLDSKAMAKKIESIFSNLGGSKRVVFVIGGPYGSSEELKKRAQLQLSLSPLTFNHLLAKAIVLEQLYRSLTIIKGLPYHNE